MVSNFYTILKSFLLIFMLLISTSIIFGCKDNCEKLNKLYENVPDPEPTIGLLYPKDTETRDLRSLDGFWTFLKSNKNDPIQGVREKWFTNDLNKFGETTLMPVPSSYNDITTTADLRDHVGTVWYEKKFYLPHNWALHDQRIWLRFSSVHYSAIVWLNGEKVTEHKIGHLPFGVEITTYVRFGSENRLTVLCDNTLENTTIPQGQIIEENGDNGPNIVQSYSFDFFNYAGIHRSVHLYTTPKVYIEDIELTTDLKPNNLGIVNFKLKTAGLDSYGLQKPPTLEPLTVGVKLRNKLGKLVAISTAKTILEGTLEVENVTPWWPYLMHPDYGYLYTIEFFLHDGDFAMIDAYRLKVGIRKLEFNNTMLLLNDKPLYLRGFGRHEDSDIRGRGLDLPLLTRDFELLKWVGANTYRTSHYPYSEESMDFADEHGIMIIDECSGVNIDIFEEELLINHKSALEQLIHRDRNHASVIMWSIANEPRSENELAGPYFGHLANYTRTIDKWQRPLTAALYADFKKDKLAQHLDVIGFNNYYGWYKNIGHLNMIQNQVIDEASNWHEPHNKPVIMTEYGADSMEGMHFLPSYAWSEDYQHELFSKHFKGFDILRSKKWFIGEFVWNFADFKTEQFIIRVGGNKKGIFSRNRQPKAVAHILRQRYFALAKELDGKNITADLFPYISSVHTEL